MPTSRCYWHKLRATISFRTYAVEPFHLTKARFCRSAELNREPVERHDEACPLTLRLRSGEPSLRTNGSMVRFDHILSFFCALRAQKNDKMIKRSTALPKARHANCVR